MELKDVFGEIESDGADLVHGRLLEWALTPPLWHAEAVGGRPHHQGRHPARALLGVQARREGLHGCAPDGAGGKRRTRVGDADQALGDRHALYGTRPELSSVRGDQDPPSSYDPQLVAKAMVYACENHKRDLVVGFGGWAVSAMG